MTCSKIINRERFTEYRYDLFSQKDKIPPEIISNINKSNNTYFSLGDDNIQLTITKNGENIALLSMHLICADRESIYNNIPQSKCPIRQYIYQLVFSAATKSKGIKLLVCGSPFSTGEYGVIAVDEANKEELYSYISTIIPQVIESHLPQADAIDAVIFKDFSNSSLPYAEKLRDNRYHPFKVDDTLILTLNKEWSSFDDYLGSLKAKYRTKANRALKLSSRLTRRAFQASDLIENEATLQELFNGVKQKVAFNLSEFKISAYVKIKEQIGDKFIVFGYYLDDKLVGFMSGIIVGNRVDAHYVGLDYNYNKEYAIYQRILYDYINIAIDNRLESINYGRTAGEIKSTIGAVPMQQTIYIKHSNSAINKILQSVTGYIKPTPFSVREPFKK